MERRELFKILAAGAAAARKAAGQHQHTSSSAPDIASYQPRFFSQIEYQMVGRLCDIVIPSDAQSPGAREAGVAFYIDTVLHYGDRASERPWRSGLTAVDREARAKFWKAFMECSRGEQEQIVALMARNELAPESELDRFFVTLKRAAVDAYVLSDVGMRQYLGYQGDAVLSEFPGCTHPEHQT
jgi:hypothetical protein